MRRLQLFAVAALAIAFSACLLAGCANNQTTAASTNANSPAKSYSDSDLEKTGRQQAGEALQAADPAVSTSSGR
jgi:ABC-type oligopeptide transport system substrate-binding subunit